MKWNIRSTRGYAVDRWSGERIIFPSSKLLLMNDTRLPPSPEAPKVIINNQLLAYLTPHDYHLATIPKQVKQRGFHISSYKQPEPTAINTRQSK